MAQCPVTNCILWILHCIYPDTRQTSGERQSG